GDAFEPQRLEAEVYLREDQRAGVHEEDTHCHSPRICGCDAPITSALGEPRNARRVQWLRRRNRSDKSQHCARSEARAMSIAPGTHMRHGSAPAAAEDTASIRLATARPARGPSARSWWRIVLVGCGVAILAYLFAETGLSAIAQSFRVLS